MQPITQVLLSVAKPLQDELVTDSGLKLYIDPSYRKEFQVSVTAVIEALPIKQNPQDKKILSQLKVGDEIAISYQVVADFEFKGDGGQFMCITEENDYVKEFSNGKGEMIRMYALPKRSGFKGAVWVGALQNKRQELIDGVQGDEETVNRWLSQFPMGKTDIYTFNNLFSYDGKDYWKCFATDIFAKKVKGHWVSVSNRVICSPIDEKIPDQFMIDEKGKHEIMIRHQDRASALSGGKEKGIKKGVIVSFDPTHLEKYEFENKPYFLINENSINGTWKSVSKKTANKK